MTTLTISPATILADLLISNGLGSQSSTWPILISRVTPSPSNQIAIYDRAGIKQGRIQSTGETVYKPGIQVTVRSMVYLDGWNKITAVWNYLDSIRQEFVNTNDQSWVLWCFNNTSGPADLGTDEETHENYFVLNGILSISPV